MASGEDLSDSSIAAMSRGNVYLILSRLFSGEADRDFVDWLCSEEAVSALESLGVDVNSMLQCPAKGSVEGAGDGIDGVIEELAEEYTALFVMPGGVSPYESVRLKGQYCQEPEWDVRKFYDRCGLVLNEERKIFSDHIGVELGFMGFLAGKEHASRSSGDEVEAQKWRELQCEFFDSHLSVWSFDFLEEAEKASRHAFYREAAALTRRFLELEQKELVEFAASMQTVQS